MRKFLFVLLLIPAFGISQTKNVISTTRMFPKADKVLDFEKALVAHAQKYHTGDWKWRVYEIQSGPDAGGYQVVEGPASWEGLDGRGDLGAEHTMDWNKTVSIYLTDKVEEAFSVYEDSLSTVALGNFSGQNRRESHVRQARYDWRCKQSCKKIEKGVDGRQ
jgi:hypothetical protein